MPTNQDDRTIENDSALRELYRSRIGDPRTGDGVRSYWLFVLGVVFGIAGVLVFLTSVPQGGIGMVSIVAVGVGLILVLVGSIVRLPLESQATTLVYVGAAVAALGIVYFVAVFPEGWSIRNGNAVVTRVYGLGLLLIGRGECSSPPEEPG